MPPAVKLAAASANLDIFWLKDESLEDSANLPIPTSSGFPNPKICSIGKNGLDN